MKLKDILTLLNKNNHSVKIYSMFSSVQLVTVTSCRYIPTFLCYEKENSSLVNTEEEI